MGQTRRYLVGGRAAIGEAFMEGGEIPCTKPDAINGGMCIVSARVGDIVDEVHK